MAFHLCTCKTQLNKTAEATLEHKWVGFFVGGCIHALRFTIHSIKRHKIMKYIECVLVK